MAATLLPSSTLLVPTNVKEAKPITTNSSPKLLVNCKTLKELKQLHCDMMKKGLCHKAGGDLNKLIVACVQIGAHESLEYARNAFEDDEGNMASLFMYNCLIRGYASAGLGDQAILLYVQMVVMGIVPDKYTFPFLLSACSKIMALSAGVQVHGAVVKMACAKLGDLSVGKSSHAYVLRNGLEATRQIYQGILSSHRYLVICSQTTSNLGQSAPHNLNSPNIPLVNTQLMASLFTFKK
ncbi:Pentatricopeptide repeat-containing protein [Spatholobus suberectus]|nr:Pentatricopeptide repeat-containing protein [Spatholobus suberectus]